MSNFRSPEAPEFVRVWQTSGSVSEAAQRMHMDPRTVKQRAVAYRKQGIDLKKFRDNAPLDVASLQELARSHAPAPKQRHDGDWVASATRDPDERKEG